MAKLGDDVFRTQGYRNIIRLFEAVPEHRELYVREESMHSYPLLLSIIYITASSVQLTMHIPPLVQHLVPSKYSETSRACVLDGRLIVTVVK